MTTVPLPSHAVTAVRLCLGNLHNHFSNQQVESAFDGVIRRLAKHKWLNISNGQIQPPLEKDGRMYTIASLKTCLDLIESNPLSTESSKKRGEILDDLHAKDGLEPEDGCFCD